jgi:hypothetical protein
MLIFALGMKAVAVQLFDCQVLLHLSAGEECSAEVLVENCSEELLPGIWIAKLPDKIYVVFGTNSPAPCRMRIKVALFNVCFLY